jgi:hypothetical protein
MYILEQNHLGLDCRDHFHGIVKQTRLHVLEALFDRTVRSPHKESQQMHNLSRTYVYDLIDKLHVTNNGCCGQPIVPAYASTFTASSLSQYNNGLYIQ